MKKLHINFAQKSHIEAQQKNHLTALNVGGFDISHTFSFKDIDNDFFQKNISIFNESRGAGYWLWKPYLILKILKSCDYGDIIFYSDSGSEFISSINPLIKLLDEQDIIPFAIDPEGDNKELFQTKRDCFIIMGCDSDDKYKLTYPLNAAFILMKKTDLIIKFMEEYLSYSTDRRCLTDDKSTLGEEYPEHNTHRHDQSIYSLLCKKYNFKYFRDPSQWGNRFNLNKTDYGQILNHTRYCG